MSRERCSDAKPLSSVAQRSDSQLATQIIDDDLPHALSVPLVYLHPLLYALSWLAGLFVHGLAAHYHLKTSKLYSTLQNDSLADRLVAFDILDASIGRHLDTLRGIHVTFVVLHVAGAVLILRNSLEDQTFAFYSVDTTQSALKVFERAGTKTRWLFVVDLVIHTVFAYRLSNRVGIDRRWSGLYIMLLVLSCLSASVAVVLRSCHHRFSTKSQQAFRVSLLLLYLLAVVVIPLSLLFEYTDYRRFADNMTWLEDSWVVIFVDDMQTILYPSWGDVFARVFLSLKLVLDVATFKVFIQRREASGIAIQPLLSSMRALANRHRMHTPDSEKRTVASKAAILRSPMNSFTWLRSQTAMALALVVWGVSVAAISAKSELRSASAASPVCISSKVGWLKNQAACRLVDINCVKLQIDGQQTELDTLWQTGFDSALVQTLVVRHCPRLEMAASLSNFTDLKILRIYNSTVVSWPAEASIDSVSTSRLHTLNLVRVTLPSGLLPPGLLSPQLPSRLRFISIIQTNLQGLPDDLDSLWKPLGPEASLAIEFSSLTEVPAALLRLNVGSISLANNAIREVPPELFQLDQLQVLSLAFTSIRALPANVPKLGNALSVVSILGTAVAEIPLWFDAFLSEDRTPPPQPNNKFRLKAGSTKWCHSLVANLRDRRVASYAAKTDCGSMDMIGYPLGLITIKYGASMELDAGQPP